MNEYLKKADLIQILENLAKDFSDRNRWEYDTIRNAECAAKVDLCDCLAQKIKELP